MMKKLISLGLEIPSDEDEIISLASDKSLSDSEIILINPLFEQIFEKVNTKYDKYKAKPLFSYEDSCLIIEYIEHWKNELKINLDSGKTIFIFLTKKIEFYLWVDSRTDRGIVRHSNYDITTINSVYIKNSDGKVILPKSKLIGNLFNNHSEIFKYDSFLDLSCRNEDILFTTQNNDKILGLKQQYEKGILIFLPLIQFPPRFFKKGELTIGINWSDDAQSWWKNFKSDLIEIDKTLKGNSNKTPTPIWVNSTEFSILSSERTKEEIQKNDEKVQALNDENNNLIDKLKENELLKDLLFESGKPLEKAVIKALQLLDYQAENYDDGILEIDQVISSPEGDRFIGECEGKENKAIDIEKFRQLLDNLNEDFQRVEISEMAIGLLFGNAQRLLDPVERTLDFTDKCKKGAERERIGLIRTVDLFNISRYLLENNNENFKTECRKQIKEQLGDIINFPDIPL